MVLIPVHCPHCQSDQVVKRGKTRNGKQRYLCQNEACDHRTFLLAYDHRARLPQVKHQIVDKLKTRIKAHSIKRISFCYIMWARGV